MEHTVGPDSESSKRLRREISKLDCFVRFDAANYWLTRIRDLVANSETYGFDAFRESLRELRREARRAEFELGIALIGFEKEIQRIATSGESGSDDRRRYERGDGETDR